MNRTIRATATLLPLLPVLTAAPAQPDPAAIRESIVQITVMNANDMRRVDSGFAIADGYLITAAVPRGATVDVKEDRRMADRTRTESANWLDVVHADCAGIDIGKNDHHVAMDPERFEGPVHSFGTVTADLKAMAEWLRSCGFRVVRPGAGA